MNNLDHARRLAAAKSICRRAGDLASGYFRSSQLKIQSKDDESPVTEADQATESMIRQAIQEQFPEDGILGEEFAPLEGRSPFRWIIDPIDGTQSFISGVPLYGCLVSVVEGDEPVVGVIYIPGLREMVYAQKGQGAFWAAGFEREDDESSFQSLETISYKPLDQALFCSTSPNYFQQAGCPELYNKFAQRTQLTRGWSDCYAYVRQAAGNVDLTIEPLMKPWDMAAPVAILRECGYAAFDFSGNESIFSSNLAVCHPQLKDDVLALIEETNR